MLGGWLSDMIGRKKVIILSAIPFAVSFVLMGTSSSLAMVLFSRVVAGVGDGVMYPNVLVYVAETSSKELRGTLSNFANISFCFGLMITYSLSLVVSWRNLAWILTIPPCLTILTMLIVPETPLWLAQKNRVQDAVDALAWLRNNQESVEELREITEKCKDEKEETIREKIYSKLQILKNKSFWKPFLIAEPLVILYSCSGISMMAFYLVTIFEEAGSSIDKLQASLIVSSWRLLISMFSSLAMLKIPRRPLFLSTTLVVGFSMAALGIFSYLRSQEQFDMWTKNLGWVPLLLILLIFAGSQLGFAPITKLIMSEVFPTEVRSTGTSLICFTSVLCLSILSKLFSQFITWFGLHGAFWFYSGVVFTCFVYGYFAMPEYSGVSLVQIEKDFKK